MSQSHRVVWSEGMFVSPQHFQEFNAHLTAETDFRMRTLTSFSWGVRRLEVDHDALRTGQFGLLELEAILPDGTVVSVPDLDVMPAARNAAEHFTVDRPLVDVYLALPMERAGLPECRFPQQTFSGESRYLGEAVEVNDRNMPGNRIEMLAARHNLSLRFSGESLDGYTSIRIAQLRKGAAGAAELQEDYAPPSLWLAAAAPVSAALRSILQSLAAQGAYLAGTLRERLEGDFQFGTSEVSKFWLLHTINSSLPLLKHHAATPDVHPVEVYRAVLQMCGALSTFAIETQASDLPPYDHENLGPTFRELERVALELLTVVDPVRYKSIMLRPDNGGFLKAIVPDESLLQPGSHWYLSASGDLPEDQIRQEIPSLLKVGSPQTVPDMVNLALPGVKLTHEPNPPGEFPLKIGHTYFKLETHGDLWDAVREARAVTVHPGGGALGGLRLELLVLRRK